MMKLCELFSVNYKDKNYLFNLSISLSLSYPACSSYTHLLFTGVLSYNTKDISYILPSLFIYYTKDINYFLPFLFIY